MIHYPTSLIQLGNLVNFSTIRFEAKHSFTKSAAQSTNNSINLLYSIMKKNQVYSFNNIFNDNLLNLKYEIIKTTPTSYEVLDNEYLKSGLKYCKINNLYCNVQLKIYGQLFKKNMFLLAYSENKEIKVAKIIEIVIFNGNIKFLCQYYDSIYDPHFHAHEINSTEKHCLIDDTYIYHFHPLNSFTNLDKENDKIYVKPFCSYVY